MSSSPSRGRTAQTMDIMISNKLSFDLTCFQPDAQGLVGTVVEKVCSVIAAPGPDKLRQLRKVVSKAAETPHKLARLQVENYGPLCIFTAQFVCAGRQVSRGGGGRQPGAAGLAVSRQVPGGGGTRPGH